MNDREILGPALAAVIVWRPRLGIAERINIEIVDDDESTERELEARCIPIERDGEGLWEFTIQIGDTIAEERIERAVVHELVHVLMEPLRDRWFDYSRDGEGEDLVTWETVVDRIADGYLRAYAHHVGISDDEIAKRQRAIRGRVFEPHA